MDERTKSLLLQLATFLSTYDDHEIAGTAAKKEARDLLERIDALLADHGVQDVGRRATHWAHGIEHEV